MPLCDLRCEKCGHEEEVFLKFHEKHKEKCNSCGKKSVIRLISGGVHAFVTNVTTVGQLAEKNRKAKGRYYEEETKEKEEWIDSMGRKNIRYKKAPKVDHALLDATPQELDKYIMEGKTPPKKAKKTKAERIAEAKELRKQK